MAEALFPKGTIKIQLHSGIITLAEYIGRQKGFECVVCGKGENCYTFNIFSSEEEYLKYNYETWGYGRDHINQVKLLEVVDNKYLIEYLVKGEEKRLILELNDQNIDNIKEKMLKEHQATSIFKITKISNNVVVWDVFNNINLLRD